MMSQGGGVNSSLVFKRRFSPNIAANQAKCFPKDFFQRPIHDHQSSSITLSGVHESQGESSEILGGLKAFNEEVMPFNIVEHSLIGLQKTGNWSNGVIQQRKISSSQYPMRPSAMNNAALTIKHSLSHLSVSKNIPLRDISNIVDNQCLLLLRKQRS